MVFTADSYLVNLYARKIREGSITINDVPILFNLKEEVVKLAI